MPACRAGPPAAALSNQSAERLVLDHSLCCVYSSELSKRTGMIQEYTPSNHRCQELAGVGVRFIFSLNGKLCLTTGVS
jgi:hypothetical protein